MSKRRSKSQTRSASRSPFRVPSDLSTGEWMEMRSAGIIVGHTCRWSNGRPCAYVDREGDVSLSAYSGRVLDIEVYDKACLRLFLHEKPRRLWSWEDLSLTFACNGYLLPPLPEVVREPS